MDSAEAEEGLERSHRLASAVVPKDELVQVDLELGATDPVVSANEPLLQVTDGAIGQRDHRFGAAAQFGSERLRAREVLETDFLQAAEALKAISTDDGTRSNILGDEAVDGHRPEVRDDGHTNSSRGSPPLLYRHQNQCRPAPFELAAAPQTGLGTAHPGVVNLYLTAQRLASEVHGRSSELVEDHPSGLVTSKPKLTLEKQCRNAPLVGRHQVGGPEPKGQGSPGIVKDGSRGERDLVAASGTLPAPPSHQSIATRVGASGTLEPLRPTAGGQVLLAGFLVSKLKLKLAERPGKAWPRHPPTLPLVVC
jgi:hypothetical protein